MKFSATALVFFNIVCTCNHDNKQDPFKRLEQTNIKINLKKKYLVVFVVTMVMYLPITKMYVCTILNYVTNPFRTWVIVIIMYYVNIIETWTI